MQAGYTIDVDRAQCLVRIGLRGFFSPDEVARLQVDKAAAITSLGCAPNQHLTLVDVSGCKIQSQEVTEAFTRLILDPTVMSRRFALVVGSSLARMQVRRTVTRDNARVFDDLASAEAWLLGDKDAAAA